MSGGVPRRQDQGIACAITRIVCGDLLCEQSMIETRAPRVETTNIEHFALEHCPIHAKYMVR